MVPPPWRGARSVLCLLNTLVSSLVIWCLTLILVLQPELSEQYKVQIHGTNFTPPSKCWGGQQCPPPARTTLLGGAQSTPPSWDRIRIWRIEAVVVRSIKLLIPFAHIVVPEHHWNWFVAVIRHSPWMLCRSALLDSAARFASSQGPGMGWITWIGCYHKETNRYIIYWDRNKVMRWNLDV